MQGFKEYKKQIEEKKQREQTLRELNGVVATLTKKQDEYAKKAEDALRRGNDSQYRAMVVLFKNAMFNLAQAQDMLANYTIAKDMCEMQQFNRKFVKSFDGIMKKIFKTCSAIKLSRSEKNFTKALSMQQRTSLELSETLKRNGAAISESVDLLSALSDEDVREMIRDRVEYLDRDLDESICGLEKIVFEKPETANEKESLSPVAENIAVSSPEFRNAPLASANYAEPVERAKSAEPIEPIATVEPCGAGEKPKKEGVRSIADLVGKGKPVAAERGEKEEEPNREEEEENSEYKFEWDSLPSIRFEDIAGLENVKDIVRVKVLLPLKNPEAFEGYEKKNGGGMCLYGPPGTGKTMIAAAIANEIGAKFCSIKPSDLLRQGMGATERAVRALFAQARRYPCAVIYFDEMDSLTPKSTKSTATRQLRSELLSQLQGIDSYKKDTNKILFLIAATNKPWDIDSAFLRPGRFGTKVYVGLPDEAAREYIIAKRLEKILSKGVVTLREDIDIAKAVAGTDGFNCSDIGNLLDKIEEISIIRGIDSGEKYICDDDFSRAFEDVHSSVQADDIKKLDEWKEENDS